MARLDLSSDTPSRASPGSRYLLLGWYTPAPCSASTLRYKQEDQKFMLILGYLVPLRLAWAT